MASLEEILQYKRDEEMEGASAVGNAAILAGLLGGAGAGAALGDPMHQAGRAVNRMRDMVDPVVVIKDVKGTGGAPAQQRLTKARGSSLGARLKPGSRMAGGLVGMIVGGALGNQIRENALAENTAASLLAKAQVQGGLSATDEALLENLVEAYYEKEGLL